MSTCKHVIGVRPGRIARCGKPGVLGLSLCADCLATEKYDYELRRALIDFLIVQQVGAR